MENAEIIVKGLRRAQGVLAAVALIVLTQPELVAPFMPVQYQPKFLAGAALVSALLPSLLSGKMGRGLAGGFWAGYRGQGSESGKGGGDADPDAA